ncbi:MAG: EF-P lysine aminoacylase GenX [Proteobacteria bacterium]|nr:EF-P lysine aminoacylase GenX [Pseudomonadota bacterium]
MKHDLARRLANLKTRARIVEGIREFFRERGFLEVETPVRIPAPLPEAHIRAMESEGWFLHPSPESCMKRLLAAGSGDIFSLCRVFRAGERGDRHLPEFTLLEWYRARAGYEALMEDCQGLLLHLAGLPGLGPRLSWGGRDLSLSPPWPRTTVTRAFILHAGKSVGQALADGSFDEAMGFSIEPELGREQPEFLVDYPLEKGSLARRKAGHPTVCERFELYAAGLELANGFSELTDPEEQRTRFLEENRVRQAHGLPPCPMPEKFLADLAHMPPAAGIALGVDRLVMLLTGASDIAEVVAFTPEEL